MGNAASSAPSKSHLSKSSPSESIPGAAAPPTSSKPAIRSSKPACSAKSKRPKWASGGTCETAQISATPRPPSSNTTISPSPGTTAPGDNRPSRTRTSSGGTIYGEKGILKCGVFRYDRIPHSSGKVERSRKALIETDTFPEDAIDKEKWRLELHVSSAMRAHWKDYLHARENRGTILPVADIGQARMARPQGHISIKKNMENPAEWVS